MSFLSAEFNAIKEKSIAGRYITYAHISPILKRLDSKFKLRLLGDSVQGLPIESITFGKGETKILIWSQMHGNESTTTKAVFDLLNFMKSTNDVAVNILESCTVQIIPMLNPDGGKAYTRVNANGVDLNRDAQDLSQPESQILRKAYDSFLPDFCFNLHDQRTQYNVGDSAKSATVSFLAPAFDSARKLSESRQDAMMVVVKMNQVLQKLIPGQVGRYDDAFNPNCVGDTFQMLRTPTVLFEAGHYTKDYERERTREFIFISLVTAISAVTEKREEFEHSSYLSIPENKKRFFDVLIENAEHLDAAYDTGACLGIRYEEILKEGAVRLVAKIEAVFGAGFYLGHDTYDCSKQSELQKLKEQPFFNTLFS